MIHDSALHALPHAWSGPPAIWLRRDMRGEPLNLYVCSVKVGEQIGFKIGSADMSPVETRGWRMTLNGQPLVVTEEQCYRGLVARIQPRQSGAPHVLSHEALLIRALLRFPRVEAVLNSDTSQRCRDFFHAPLAAILATLAACMAMRREVPYAGGTVFICRPASCAQGRSARFIDVFAGEASGPRSAAAAWLASLLQLIAVGDAPSIREEVASSADEAPLVPVSTHTIIRRIDPIEPRPAGCPVSTLTIMDTVPASCPPTQRGSEASSSPDGKEKSVVKNEEENWAAGVDLAMRFLELQVVEWRADVGPPSKRPLIDEAFRAYAALCGWDCTISHAKKALPLTDQSWSVGGIPHNLKYLRQQYAVYKRDEVVETLKTDTPIKSESDPLVPTVKSEPQSEPGASSKRSPSGSPLRGLAPPTVEGKRARSSPSGDYVLSSPDMIQLTPTTGLNWLPGEMVSEDNVTSGGVVLSGRRFVVLKFDADANKYVLADCETESQYHAPTDRIRVIDGAVEMAVDDTVPDGELGIEQRAEMHHGRPVMNNYAYFLRATRKMGSDEQWLAWDKRDQKLGQMWLGEDVMYYCNLRQGQHISEDRLNELLDHELQHVTTMLRLKKPDDEELERQEERAVDKV